MREYYQFVLHIFCLKLIFFMSSAIVLPQKTDSPSLLYPCWNLNSENGFVSLNASDNGFDNFFLSFETGIVNSINLKDGTQNWKTELGGNILKTVYEGGFLYVLSLDETEKTITLRALSIETGIVKWGKSVALKGEIEGAAAHSSISASGNFIFLLTKDGDLYTLSKDKGEEVRRKNFNEKIIYTSASANPHIVFGTSAKNLISYSVKDEKITKIVLKEIPTVIHTQQERIIIGDKTGRLISLKKIGEKTKEDWQTRVGAEISVITETPNGLAVSSNDNFVYLVSPKNGEKIWKRRFAGRTATTIISNSGETLAVVNLNNNSAFILDTENGKIVNQISLPNGEFFIGKPFSSNNMVVFPTSTGLRAYASTIDNCPKSERPETVPGL